MRQIFGVGDQPVPGFKLVESLGGDGFYKLWKVRDPSGNARMWKTVDLVMGNAPIEIRNLKLVAKIRHSYLAPLTNFWQLYNGSILVIEMDIPFKSLRERLEECRREGKPGIPTDELIPYMEQVAEGIDYLNRPVHDFEGNRVAIYHRDLRPECLLLYKEGNRLICKVSDFGLVKPVTKETVQNSMSLNPGDYNPPEFFEGKSSTSSDQFNLAVIYYELRTGSLPFPGSMLQQLQSRLNESPTLDLVFPGEQPVIKTALAYDPTKRHRSTMDFVRQLRSAVAAGPGTTGLLAGAPPGGSAAAGVKPRPPLGEPVTSRSPPGDMPQAPRRGPQTPVNTGRREEGAGAPLGQTPAPTPWEAPRAPSPEPQSPPATPVDLPGAPEMVGNSPPATAVEPLFMPAPAPPAAIAGAAKVAPPAPTASPPTAAPSVEPGSPMPSRLPPPGARPAPTMPPQEPESFIAPPPPAASPVPPPPASPVPPPAAAPGAFGAGSPAPATRAEIPARDEEPLEARAVRYGASGVPGAAARPARPAAIPTPPPQPAPPARRAPIPDLPSKEASIEKRAAAKALERHATVRYYQQMNPNRMYPLLVILSKDEIAQVAKVGIAQQRSEGFVVRQDVSVELEPILPGCNVYPAKASLQITGETLQTTFWVAPWVLGAIHDARLVVRQQGEVLTEVALEIRVTQQTSAIVAGVMTFFLPFASVLLRRARLDLESQLDSGFDLYGQILRTLLNSVGAELLGMVLVGVTAFLYWRAMPKQRDVFWDLEPASKNK